MIALDDAELIRLLPKTDLHVHLDGSLRIPTLIDLAKRHDVELPEWTEKGLKETVFRSSYRNLGEYLHGFKYTCAVLRDAESLERVSFELAEDNFNEGVRYFEVRFAPQLHVNARLDITETLHAVARGLRRAETLFNSRPEIVSGAEPAYRAGNIVCAMRMFTDGFSPYFKDYVGLHRFRPMREVIRQAAVDLVHAAVRVRDDYNLPIVGFDLAGQENGYPAGVHWEAYDYAHRNFLKKTVHAGEAFGPESIFQAITRLHADRIGHGYHLFSPGRIQDPDIHDREKYVANLAQYISDRRITIEVCLTSNLQTMPELTGIQEHNFRQMLEARISTTLCTDNRLISDTTVSREVQLAVNTFDIPARRLKNLLIYGFKRSFYPGTYGEKRAYVRHVIDYYERVAERFGLQDD